MKNIDASGTRTFSDYYGNKVIVGYENSDSVLHMMFFDSDSRKWMKWELLREINFKGNFDLTLLTFDEVACWTLTPPQGVCIHENLSPLEWRLLMHSYIRGGSFYNKLKNKFTEAEHELFMSLNNSDNYEIP